MKRIILLLLFMLCARSTWAQSTGLTPYLASQDKVTVRKGTILGSSTATVTTIAETTFTAVASSTKYVYIDLTTTPTLTSNTTGFPTSSVYPIATFAADINGHITTFVDNRPEYFMAGGSGGGITSPKGLTDAGSSTIYLTDPIYGFPGTAQFVCDAGITNASNVVTTPSTDRPFTGSTIRNAVGGDTVWAANAQCGGENAVVVPISLIAPTSTICTNVAIQVHQISVCQADGVTPQNAAGTCAVVNKDNCVLVWGPDATTALNAAWNAAARACGTLILPAGGIIFGTPPTNTDSLCPGPAGGNDVGSALTVMGQGPYSTMLLQRPDSSCATVNFGSPAGQRVSLHDFGVASFSPGTAVCDTKGGFSAGFYSEVYNLWILDYFPCNNVACSFTFTPVTTSGVGNAPVYVHDNVCLNSGNTGCFKINNGAIFSHNVVQNTNQCLSIGNITGGSTYTLENTLILCGIQGAVNFGSGANQGTWYSTNDVFDNRGSTLHAVKFNACAAVTSGTAIFHNPIMGSSPSGAGTVLCIPSGMNVTISGERSVISGTNANGGNPTVISNAGTLTLGRTTVTTNGTGALLNSSGTVNFDSGNTFSGGAITNTGVFAGFLGGVLEGSCTGTVTSAATVGLYGLGQTAARTCTSVVVDLGQTMSKAGNVYALYCNSGTAGNQATSACTVVKNGAAQTMTCSMNGVTSCSDGVVAHVVPYVAGDVIGVEVIAGVADTLANVKGLIVAQ